MKRSPKIKDLDSLAEVCATARRDGARVVHCHGVFDLLHLGHIRHFQEARTFGELLVVTITPDRFVNKGPHRPAFGEELRAEAIAALACVDHVGINRWPSAVETIGLLKPRYFCKGSEYRAREADRTRHISLEEEAIAANGGELAFTEDVVFSSSHLLNRHLQVFPDDVCAFLDDFAARVPAERVLERLDASAGLRVLAVGEAIVDRYQYCSTIGKSSKDPTLVVRRLQAEEFLGGILAIADDLSSFCDSVTLLSVLGERESRSELVESRLRENVRRRLLTRPDAPTILKERLVDRYSATKIVEIYDLEEEPLDGPDDDAFCEALREELAEHDVVLVKDFGHGLLSERAIRLLSEKARFLALSVQSNAGNLGFQAVSRYPRADFLVLTENELRLEARERRGDLESMLRHAASRLGCRSAFVTRGKFGCLGHSPGEGTRTVPAFAQSVVDRVGGGSAFLALSAPFAALEASLEETGFVGNAAAAQAVSQLGHREPIGKTALVRQIQCLLK